MHLADTTTHDAAWRAAQSFQVPIQFGRDQLIIDYHFHVDADHNYCVVKRPIRDFIPNAIPRNPVRWFAWQVMSDGSRSFLAICQKTKHEAMRPIFKAASAHVVEIHRPETTRQVLVC
jgi:hypothetical protein